MNPLSVASSGSLGYSKGGNAEPSCRVQILGGVTVCVCRGAGGTVSMCLCLPWLVCVSVVLRAGDRKRMDDCLCITGSDHVPLCHAPASTCVKVYISVPDLWTPCDCISVLSPRCRVGFLSVLGTIAPPLERVQLPSSGGGNRTLSCLACDFCLDISFCCDRTCSQDPGQSAWLS